MTLPPRAVATGTPADGFLFPLLWGPDSYNNGAGMNRVLTAARFIKARMPLGQEHAAHLMRVHGRGKRLGPWMIFDTR